MAAGPEPGGECGICYEALWGAGGAPRELRCRHSLCQRCLRGMVRAAPVPFVSCPFCRAVTLLPELPPAAPGEEEEEAQREEGGGVPAGSGQGSPRPAAVPVMCSPHAPVFAVSSSVSPRASEAPGAFVLGLLGRGVLLDSQPPLASMENLRLGFAAGILVLIVCTFFLLVFLK